MKIYYVNSKNEKIYLDRAPYYMTENSKIFDYEWGYDTSHSRVENLSKDITEKPMQVAIVGIDKVDCYRLRDEFFNATDIDCVNETPGKLYFGDYYIKCYLVTNEKDSKYMGNAKSVLDLMVVRESITWIKETSKDFIYSELTDITGRGYPYGYNYDYSAGSGSTGSLVNEHFAPCHFVMEISGYAFKPTIAIGDHVYKVNETVRDNEVLIIDSKNKSITLKKKNGDVNIFSKREMASYIFEKIPAGELRVYWNSEFDFTITLYEERGEPKWT